jgi:hypothetical protein
VVLEYCAAPSPPEVFAVQVAREAQAQAQAAARADWLRRQLREQPHLRPDDLIRRGAAHLLRLLHRCAAQSGDGEVTREQIQRAGDVAAIRPPIAATLRELGLL